MSLKNMNIKKLDIVSVFAPLVLINLLILGGCGPAVVAGGAAAGYYVHQDERRLGQIIDDASITAAIKTKFLKDPDIIALDINIDTLHGVVTLYGSVAGIAIEDKAIDLVKEVDGVKKIISKMTIIESEDN